ncbi:uncharacterized protein [Engystomops pustulosus]|uniref:uncharacterized protein n=1 Tax=Engystomops pustulosus TaxID=76066 RepID=UPI003AFA4BF5
MNSDRCFTLPSDINANTAPKNFTETSPDCSGVCCCFKADSELLELPFFEEDISKVFEIDTNLRTMKRKKKTFLKRKWSFRKYKPLNVKTSARSSMLITAQENRRMALKNTGKENKEEPGIRSADRYLPSGLLEACDIKTNKMIMQTQQFYSSAPESQDGIQITENIEQSINKEDSPVLGQSQNTVVTEEEHCNKLDLKMRKEENCDASVELETHSEVIEEQSQESEIKGSGDGNVEKQIINSQRVRPNYFVAIPITNDEILDLIEDVQEHILLKEPKLLRALIPAEKVHITILVAHLRTEDDIKRAVSALLQSKEKVEKLLIGKQFALSLHGIGEFNNQVIFLKITKHENKLLSEIAEVVKDCFISEGVNISGSKDFKPHLTFLKLSKAPSLRRKGFKKICSELYKEYEDFSFGTELFSRIDLCSMHKKNKESGYYYCESSILIDSIKPKEGGGSIHETNVDSKDPGKETAADFSITSCLAEVADKISLEIANVLTVSQNEGIKETDGQPEATNTNPGEKSCFQSTPDLFLAQPIASTAVDDGPEKQN